jgi:hypothetical protein
MRYAILGGSPPGQPQPNDPQPPFTDPPDKPMRDPPADPPGEPTPPFGDPMPAPGGDPPLPGPTQARSATHAGGSHGLGAFRLSDLSANSALRNPSRP